MTQAERTYIWEMSDTELVDELSALNGTEEFQRSLEREALRRLLMRTPKPSPYREKPNT